MAGRSFPLEMPESNMYSKCNVRFIFFGDRPVHIPRELDESAHSLSCNTYFHWYLEHRQ